MLRSALTGFLIGPLLLVAVVLLWSKAGLALVIAIGVLFGALLVAVLAGAATGSLVQRRRAAGPTKAVPPRPPGNVTLTSTPDPVRATASENLANDNRWRQAFMGWRYGAPPKDGD